MKYLQAAILALGLLAAAPAARAGVIVLDFEGVGNNRPVSDFYDGNGGPDYDIVFSDDAFGLVDADAGGTGQFANEPSGDTVMYFPTAGSAVLNALGGFDTGFSFFYSSAVVATISVYSGLDATGSLLASLNLAAQFATGCGGDPTGIFCNWTAVGVLFSGTAYSIDFSGALGSTALDDITFGSDRAGSPGAAVPVPEPRTLGLLGLGLVALALAARRRRHR